MTNMLEADELEPLGAWLVDSVVLTARERFHGSLRGTADFLHTNPRNISRWIPQIDQRAAVRESNVTWGESRRLISEWIKETSSSVQAPLELSQNMLLSHLEKLEGKMRVASRAKVMDMSIPTYQKRVKNSDG